MKKFRTKAKENAYLALTVPTLLCFITFITNLLAAFKDGYIDNSELHQLLSTADGFETVVWVVMMLFLKTKKK